VQDELADKTQRDSMIVENAFNDFDGCQRGNYIYHPAYGQLALTLLTMRWLLTKIFTESKANRIRLQILSDLHLEVGKQYSSFTFPATAPYLLLAGDVGRLIDYSEYLAFLQSLSGRYKTVLLVLGNHEFYGLDYESGLAQAQRLVREPALADAVVLLHRARWDDPDSSLTILGCTLWSDISQDRQAIVQARINDFSRISAWTVQKHNQTHADDLAWLRRQVDQLENDTENNDKRRLLVATHHAPCLERTSHPDHADNPWVSAFATDLLTDRGWDGVEVWVFGHTHYSTDFLLPSDSRAWTALTPPLAEWILEAVSSMGFAQMTPVQAATMPHLAGNKDVVMTPVQAATMPHLAGNKDVVAVTGSGKTLAYLIPAVQRLLRLDEPTKRHEVAAIIVSPTRELAAQIHSVLLSLLRFHPPSAELLPCLDSDEKRPGTSQPVVVPQLLVGGTTTPAQDLAFFLRHSPNLLIASPGRLVELLASPHVHCPQSSFDLLILDEADRLLDLGFKQHLQGILSRLPKQRRTGLFSASVGEAVTEIIRVGLRNPVKIEVRVRIKDGSLVQERKIPASLQMTYTIKPASQKLPALCRLLQQLPVTPQRSIVFLSSCAAVDYFQNVLPALLPPTLSLVPLHGKHPAKVRDKNFARFLSSVSPTMLLTTDLAARGLDIPQVDLVVQVDPPSDPKVFIHRSGRAGRAGRKGLAVVMLHPGREEDYVRFLDVRKTPVLPLDPDLDPDISPSDASAATQTIRSIVKSDRALHDKAQRAFVSWVRSHGAHHATSIFRVADLDWSDLAEAWGLLRLPKMPELRQWEGDRFLGLEINWHDLAYKDVARETARQAALLQEEGQEGEEGKQKTATRQLGKRKPSSESWSAKHEKDECRLLRREKRHRKREAQRRADMSSDDLARQSELQDLIDQVRRRNQASSSSGHHHEDEFQGFDD
ncbi:hypothetical protein L249_6147, partial [Ophiocordyceps polyrhachis-furcata BCC 54312]